MHAPGRRALGGIAVVAGAGLVAAVAVIAAVGPSGRAASAPADANAQRATSIALVTGSNTLARSITTTQAQLREEPRNWLAWASLGAAYVQQGRATADPTYYPKAEQALRRSLALNTHDDFI